MAILESDYMDFGNGIIGDDTFDIWRKKTNSLKVEIDDLNTSLTNKINTDFGALPSTYIPIAGSAKQVSTQISFTSTPKFSNATTIANSLDIGGTTLYSSANTLQINHAVTSASTLKGTKLEASSQIKFGTKDYNVPSAPSSLSILQSNVAGQMSWVNPADAFANAGGLQQTTTVFEEIVPVGSIIPWASTEAPTGGKWLVCNGGTFSEGAYPDLAAELGDTYATHSGDTYYLPDLGGRVPVGTGTGGSVNFGSVGSKGGTSNTSTGDVTLSIDQIPAHAHKFFDDRGNQHLALSDANLEASGDALTSQGPNESGKDTGVSGTTYTGGGANGSIHGGTTTDGDLSSLSGTSPHSHTLTPGSRVQPYLTINYIIKAKTDSKIDFKIDLQDSGLIMQDSVGVDGDNITPVNETVKLKINPETTAFRIDIDGKLAFATGTVLVPADLSVTGADFKLRNESRAGGNSHSGRALVHGNGSSIGDPVLNGYNRKSVTTLNDIGGFGANDTLIINYSDISPNSVGDYTGGVVINGTKAIMFEDGTILNSAQRKGKCKRRCERHSAQLASPQFSDSFIYINDDDNPVLHGNSNGVERMYLNASKEAHGQEHMLPNDELAEKLFITYYNVHCLTKTGKLYSTGYGYSSGTTLGVRAEGVNGTHLEWTRAGCENNDVVFDKVCSGGDITSYSFAALDTQGYLWASGVNEYGLFANGTTINSYDETAANTSELAQKRDSLAYPALGTNRFLVPHVLNPLATSAGVLTNDPSQATQFKTTFVDAGLAGSWSGSSHLNTLIALGADGRVYMSGYGARGQMGDGTSSATNNLWKIVKTSFSTELTGITNIYYSGEDSQTSFFAKNAAGQLFGWGANSHYELGDGTNVDKNYATLLTLPAVQDVYTNNAGSPGSTDADSFSMALTADTAPRLYVAGKQNRGESGSGGGEDQTFTTWTQVTNGPCNSANYTIQSLHRSNGNANNFSFIIAKSNSTGKLSLWGAGYNGAGNLGHVDGGVNGGAANQTSWVQISFGSALLEKVIDIHPARQYNVEASTFIYLNDGRVFAAGDLRFGLSPKPAYQGNHYKFTQLSI